ncbi:MAG: bifunctional (p)ppGpp synthetase/guanosine-3',5'-bis(diphosphate) 3'-pyrophosphohydrolase [Oxalobacteraceae bacterium]|nr:bifunctional (p)ppGpp synthetase/guanosine-3',5'-bis(diphosphate) 3'-pyrophosphohydrolase [Oxalobacteraceae bacterium]
MVSTTLVTEGNEALIAGLRPEDGARLLDAQEFVRESYANRQVTTGQDALGFSRGVVSALAGLRTDADTRIAGILFELVVFDEARAQLIESHFGTEVANMVTGIRQLMRLHEGVIVHKEAGKGKHSAATQLETLRKMTLAMATDMRVVLVRLASRLTTLRYFADCKLENDMTLRYARETFDLYAPLANRLGVWQLKWELEDLSFRFSDPAGYKKIARMLEERRVERESFVEESIVRLKSELAMAGIKAEVYGRPKHIFSIWNKMQGKDIDFSRLHDVRAFRVIVEDVKTCYAVLSIVHNIWTPVTEEFDDYIARPKSNGYQSLHTIVQADDGRTLEVQIRTQDMHRFAEYGVAAHWRYKEGTGGSADQKYDEKIAWLRQLLTWKSEVADTVVGEGESDRQWVEQLKSASLNDRIYVMTPQARVIELPAGATPIDFAYHLHSDIGHRCRGAKINGTMVPLNTPLKNAQTVEIITAKGEAAASGAAGPSRDWLADGYTASQRTRAKIRAWFNAIEEQETLSRGRTVLEKTLQREGKTAVNLEDLAHKLGFQKLDELLLAVGNDRLSLRLIEQALRVNDVSKALALEDAVLTRKSKASSVTQGAKSGVLVLGTSGLLTSVASCCKPAPPDPIVGFITRGKGISIHRTLCKNFSQMCLRAPERMVQTEWGTLTTDTVYPVDVFVQAADRQGLLRDISDIFLREKINVIGVSTRSSKGQAFMSFTGEIASTAQLQRALAVIRDVKGVLEVRRN